MKRPAQSRISVDQSTTTRLNPAFTGLKMEGLPEANVSEPEPPRISADPNWKMGRVILQRETAHRGGKTVIVVHEFATHLPASVIERVAKILRAGCGCGGTVKDRRIEIQGDQAGKIRVLLEAEGFQVAGVR